MFYVWFDAPDRIHRRHLGMGRRRAARSRARPADDAEWERWWRGPAADDVTYVEFMGKDNVPFHTVGFPCTLIGVNERAPTAAHDVNAPWKLVDQLKGFNWLNYYGGKFSTSQNRGVFMDQALELLPADYWRWYLIANAPESSDAILHLGAVPGAGEQGPGRRAGQLRQPRAALRRQPLRQCRAGRRRPGSGRA